MEEILNQAERLEKEYDWHGAAELYQKALKLLPNDDFSRMGEIHEWSGYASYRSAFQAENADEFRERLHQAISSYEKAKELYGKMDASAKTPSILRCDAMIAFMDYWLANDAPEKKSLLNNCWRLTTAALKAFEDADISLEYGKTYNMLSMSAIFEFTLELDFQERVRIMKEAVECGERAIKSFSTSDDIYGLARAYARTVVCLGVFTYYCKDISERDPYYQKGLDYWKKAKELSEEIVTIESLCPVFGCQPFFGLEGSDEAMENHKKGLKYAKKTRDKFLIGCAFDWLVYHTVWKAMGLEDKDEIVQLAKTAMQYVQDAREQFSKISFISPRADLAWIEACPVDFNVWMADLETSVIKKRNMLEKALRDAPDILKKAEHSGYPESMIYAYGISGTVLFSLAKIESNCEDKKRLLEQSLRNKEECVARTEQLTPLLYWNLGIVQIGLTKVKSDLVELVEDDETEKNLLLEVAQAKDSSLKLLIKNWNFLRARDRAVRRYLLLSEIRNLNTQMY